jgi:hypothetical protein
VIAIKRSEREDNLHDLAKIVATWPSLPEPIRRAMLALIG